MTRWLAGVFDPSGRAASARLPTALSPHASNLFTRGPLRVAYTGAAHPDSDVVCLLDGVLDNGGELSRLLGAPPGTPPEALLLAGWRRWGRDLPERMLGDFALLIWDQQHEEGLIARDHLGVRSMFLHESSGVCSFACEIRHLIALLPRRPAPDGATLAHWLTMSRRPGSATLYAGLRRLDPGTTLLLDRHGTHAQRYWAPRFVEPLDGSSKELATQLRSALDLAVRRRLDPSASSAVLMSGGLDSSSVAAVAATEARERVTAYSAVFPDHPAVDESGLISELRTTLDLAGVNADVRAGGLLASALDSIREWELPLRSWGDFWALPLLRAAASNGARVVLGGDGGDELFGARSYLLADRVLEGRPYGALQLAHELPGAGDDPPRRDLARIMVNTALSGAAPYRLHDLVERVRAHRQTPGWLRPNVAQSLIQSDDPLAWKRLDGPRWWAHTAHGLTRGIEETGVFEHQRRRAETAGLQARHPLFDLELLELALRQPPLATFDRHMSRPILRASVADVLPDAVRLRPGKAWFDSLLIDSLAGSDGAVIRRLLTDPRSELGAYVDLASLQRSFFDHPSIGAGQPEFRWMWQIWRLATAECWLRFQTDPGGEMLPTGAKASAARIELKAVGAKPGKFN